MNMTKQHETLWNSILAAGVAFLCVLVWGFLFYIIGITGD